MIHVFFDHEMRLNSTTYHNLLFLFHYTYSRSLKMNAWNDWLLRLASILHQPCLLEQY